MADKYVICAEMGSRGWGGLRRKKGGGEEIVLHHLTEFLRGHDRQFKKVLSVNCFMRHHFILNCNSRTFLSTQFLYLISEFKLSPFPALIYTIVKFRHEF